MHKLKEPSHVLRVDLHTRHHDPTHPTARIAISRSLTVKYKVCPEFWVGEARFQHQDRGLGRHTGDDTPCR
jgi:hypothetical protein